MKLILLVAIVTTFFIYCQADGECDRVVFRNSEFYKQVKRIEHRISGLRELVYSRVHDALFFKYDYYKDDRTKSRRKKKIGYISLRDELFHPIHIKNVNGIAADNIEGIVYIGTKDGLYTLDRDLKITKTHVRHYVTSVSVGKSGVYYVTLTHKVFLLTGRSQIKLNLLEIARIRHIAVNRRSKIVGVSKTGDVLTMTSNGLKLPKLKATNVVVGENDEIYAYSRHGLFELSDTDQFYKVVNLRKLQGIAFVSSEEIYTASGGYIYRLIRSYDNQCYYE